MLAISATLSACGGGGGCVLLCSNSGQKFEIVEDIAAADLNGDGHSDVVLPVSQGFGTPGYASVYLHIAASGKGYQPRHDYLGNSYPGAILVADLNGDGRPDVAMASNHSDSVAALLNSATSPGSLTVSQTFAVPSANRVFAADMNGDGLIDLVMVGGPNGAVLTALQTVPGTFATPTTLQTGVDAYAVGDLDDDGQPDPLVADHTEAKLWFLTPRATSPRIARSLSLRTLTNGIGAAAIADVDGDGHNDVILVDRAAHSLVVWRQDPVQRGVFLPPGTYTLPAGTGGFNIVVADLDGDGRVDLVTGGSSAVAVFLQDRSQRGTFQAATSFAAASSEAIAVTDVDEDGHPDIVTDNGVSAPTVNGVMTVVPGVLYQDPTRPGSFVPQQDLKYSDSASILHGWESVAG
jgi:hypothetical protein